MSAPALGRPAVIQTNSSDVEARRTEPSGNESGDLLVPVAIPTEHDIAVLAYSLWERRSRPEGSPDVDWFDAKRQLS